MCLKKYADLEKRNISHNVLQDSFPFLQHVHPGHNYTKWLELVILHRVKNVKSNICTCMQCISKYKKPKVNLCLMEIERNFKCFIPIKGVIVFIRIRFYLPANACIIIIVKITLHFKVVQSMKKLELYEFFKRSAEDTVDLKVSDKQTCTVIYYKVISIKGKWFIICGDWQLVI